MEALLDVREGLVPASVIRVREAVRRVGGDVVEVELQVCSDGGITLGTSAAAEAAPKAHSLEEQQKLAWT